MFSVQQPSLSDTISQDSSSSNNQKIIIPWIIRGTILSDATKIYETRNHISVLHSLDPKIYTKLLSCRDPQLLTDIEELKVSDIIEFLIQVGEALEYSSNSYLKEAATYTTYTSGLTAPIIENIYADLAVLYKKNTLEAIVDPVRPYLDNWVNSETICSGTTIKALGVRMLHIPAGKVPIISALSIINTALTKSDGIIKVPSNDPLTAIAILKTMIDVDPHHPVTKHLSAAYWKGGMDTVEQELIQPTLLEKVIAWGGQASISHIKNILRPGIDVITLDPKFSISYIANETFTQQSNIEDAAEKAARDCGHFNQEACLSSRVIYVHGTPQQAYQFGEFLYKYLVTDTRFSTKPKEYSSSLKQELDSIKYLPFYQVLGGNTGEGAVIISQEYNDIVAFADHLCNKTVNIVPINNIATLLGAINVATQTIGVYPSTAKATIRDLLVRAGAQRIVTLGNAATGMIGVPQDGIELIRRMVKWVVDEEIPS